MIDLHTSAARSCASPPAEHNSGGTAPSGIVDKAQPVTTGAQRALQTSATAWRPRTAPARALTAPHAAFSCNMLAAKLRRWSCSGRAPGPSQRSGARRALPPGTTAAVHVCWHAALCFAAVSVSCGVHGQCRACLRSLLQALPDRNYTTTMLRQMSLDSPGNSTSGRQLRPATCRK